MPITINNLEYAYIGTCEESRVTLSDGLKDVDGEKMNVVYSLLSRLSESTKFDSILIHSDGGVEDFMATYAIGNYYVIIDRFVMYQNDIPFCTTVGFVDWLDYHEKKVILAAGVVLNQQNQL